MIVFLDTNCIDNVSLDFLFGSKDSLADLADLATIVLPNIVLEELITHKKKHFHGKMRELQSNPLAKHIEIDRSTLSDLSFDKFEKALRDDQSIPYLLCFPHDKESTLDELCNLVLHNKAPFDKGSDKGFKDAIIALSIRDYISDNDDEFLLVTKDGRLYDYFDNSPSITVVSSINEALSIVQDAPIEDDTELEENLPSNPASKPERETVSDLIDRLCESRSFAQTHKIIEQLSEQTATFSTTQGRRLLQGALSNRQIGWILTDQDVMQFYAEILKSYGDTLTNDQYASFVDLADLPNQRLDDCGNPFFSNHEKKLYSNFANSLISHIESRAWLSTIRIKQSSLERDLQSIISKASLDKKACGWADLVSLFIEGSFEVSESALELDVLSEFSDYYSKCGIKKQAAILDVLKARLGDVPLSYDDDIPF